MEPNRPLRELAHFVRHEIAWWQVLELGWHLLWCPSCRPALIQMVLITRHVRHSRRVEPSPELADRIARRLRELRNSNPDDQP